MSIVSRRWVGVLLSAGLLGVGLGAAEVPKAADPACETCLRLVKEGRSAEALPACREAVGRSPSRELRLAAARAEFLEGDPETAVGHLEAALVERGLSSEEKVLYGRCLLAVGRNEDGEAELREALRARPDAEGWRALLDLRLNLGRLSGAEGDLQGALESFPADCGIRASATALYALLGREEEAARQAEGSRRLGCPPFEWARGPGMAERLDRLAFQALLMPQAIAAGMASLDDREARFRLQLLEKAMGPEAIAPLEEDFLKRKDYGIRLREAHLILSQREKGLAALRRLLRTEDLMARKLLLRQMVLAPHPLWIPLLQSHLEREAAPQNRSLTALALAGAYEKAGRRAEAEALRRSIPPQEMFPLEEGAPPALELSSPR